MKSIIGLIALASSTIAFGNPFWLADNCTNHGCKPFIHHVKWPAYTHHPECFPNDQINRQCVLDKVMNHSEIVKQLHKYCHETQGPVFFGCIGTVTPVLDKWPPYVQKYEEYVSHYYHIELEKLRNEIYNLEMQMAKNELKPDYDHQSYMYLVSDFEQCLDHAQDRYEMELCVTDFKNQTAHIRN